MKSAPVSGPIIALVKVCGVTKICDRLKLISAAGGRIIVGSVQTPSSPPLVKFGRKRKIVDEFTRVFYQTVFFLSLFLFNGSHSLVCGVPFSPM